MNVSSKDRGDQYFLPSLTRISDFSEQKIKIDSLERNQWQTGDYVACEIKGSANALYTIELSNGRMVPVLEGDKLIGVLGKRAATLEGVGDWEAIKQDGQMQMLTGAGLLGAATSVSKFLPRLMDLSYLGHVVAQTGKLNMLDFVTPVKTKKFSTPVIMLVGTSMSAGKTTTGRMIIHELKKMGKRVVGAKLTGAGRYRDILAYSDAGADEILDFVDSGLASTVVDESSFQHNLDYMLSRIQSLQPDLAVIEAGASPLEPYNSGQVIKAVNRNIVLMVLSASDPYAVLGVQTAFGIKPDLVTGPATNTTAAINLVQELSGINALNLLDSSCLPELRKFLSDCF